MPSRGGLSMRKTRAVGLTAVAAVVTLVAGCSSVGGGTSSSSTAAAAPSESSEASTAASGSSSGGPTADTINVGMEQSPGGFNVQSSSANSVYTGFVDNLLESNFATILPDTTIKPNTEFGTYEKTSDDPLTVTYTFNDKAVWSDGVPIDCDDAHAGLGRACPAATRPGRTTMRATPSTSSPRRPPTASPRSTSPPARRATSRSPTSTRRRTPTGRHCSPTRCSCRRTSRPSRAA